MGTNVYQPTYVVDCDGWPWVMDGLLNDSCIRDGWELPCRASLYVHDMSDSSPAHDRIINGSDRIHWISI